MGVCLCMCVCARLAAAAQNLRFCFVFLLLLLSLSACWAVRLSASFLATKISCATDDETRRQRNFQCVCCCCCYCLLFITVTAVGRVCCWCLSRSLSSCPTLTLSLCSSFLVFFSQHVGGVLFVQKLVASGKDTTWTWNRFPHSHTHTHLHTCLCVQVLRASTVHPICRCLVLCYCIQKVVPLVLLLKSFPVPSLLIIQIVVLVVILVV